MFYLVRFVAQCLCLHGSKMLGDWAGRYLGLTKETCFSNQSEKLGFKSYFCSVYLLLAVLYVWEE